jgi:hemerythrin
MKKEESKPIYQQIIEDCGGEEAFMKVAGLNNLKRNKMTKTEIANGLNNCISMVKDKDNTYVTRMLKAIQESLVTEWSESDMYFEQIKQELNYEQRKNEY